jgi:hypothetical protein
MPAPQWPWVLQAWRRRLLRGGGRWKRSPLRWRTLRVLGEGDFEEVRLEGEEEEGLEEEGLRGEMEEEEGFEGEEGLGRLFGEEDWSWLIDLEAGGEEERFLGI